LATFFAEIGGGQIDGEAGVWESQAGVLDRRTNAFAGFLDGGIGKADDGEPGQASGDVHFDLDDGAFQPDDGAAEDLGQHLDLPLRVNGSLA
jgi:hypothetical protein